MLSTRLWSDRLEAAAEVSPAWLADIRRLAWERYNVLELPKSNEEIWRYTDLSLLDLEQYDVPAFDGSQRSLDKLPDRAAGVLELAGTSSAGRLVHVDGSSFSGSLSREAQAAGVIFTDLESAANDHEKLPRRRLGRLV